MPIGADRSRSSVLGAANCEALSQLDPTENEKTRHGQASRDICDGGQSQLSRLNHPGSRPLRGAGIVEIWNKNLSARISPYVILGQRGYQCCILNGAAARTCQPGSGLICNSPYLDESRITTLKPKVLTFEQDNRIRDRLTYSVQRDLQGKYTFSILRETGGSESVPLLVSFFGRRNRR